ncbi:MAG: NAD(P)-binding protein [Deltaproteobacteria bacterium]|nr:NAD(P)-binding protein [Deltaproteobacteria bacterium]
MDTVEHLVVGAGASGLSYANWIREETRQRGGRVPEVLVIERDREPGGYCKTVKQDGFVWDYSGHFFHFRHPEIEAWLRARMPDADVRTVLKKSLIRFKGRDVDFPFQKNIHQLERQDFIDCLVDLHFREEQFGSGEPRSFQEMLYRRLGKSICEMFLVPYNEKLYACSLDSLDQDAMGRFFPHADVDAIIRNMRQPDNRSYNDSFTYPLGGAIEYIHALLRDLPSDTVAYDESLVAIDLERRVARTTRREIRFEHLVSSAPFPKLLAMCGVEHDASAFSWNKVLVFNLGFDRKGASGVHWMYFPDRARSFYRVGWYDNIMGSERMSLYVEIGATRDARFDVDSTRARVLEDLAAEKIVDGHSLVSWHSVVLDPAYVHVTRQSLEAHSQLSAELSRRGVHTVGRYGGWTYCSIEDNLVETRALARKLAGDRR